MFGFIIGQFYLFVSFFFCDFQFQFWGICLTPTSGGSQLHLSIERSSSREVLNAWEERKKGSTLKLIESQVATFYFGKRTFKKEFDWKEEGKGKGKHAWLMLANLLSPLAIKNICANRKHQGDKTFRALISICPVDFRLRILGTRILLFGLLSSGLSPTLDF